MAGTFVPLEARALTSGLHGPHDFASPTVLVAAPLRGPSVHPGIPEILTRHLLAGLPGARRIAATPAGEADLPVLSTLVHTFQSVPANGGHAVRASVLFHLRLPGPRAVRYSVAFEQRSQTDAEIDLTIDRIVAETHAWLDRALPQDTVAETSADDWSR